MSPSPTPAKRRAVFVVGSGRSGTSTVAGALRTLGMHVPQPEVAADDTNPKGFGEPQWVVDLHTELLQRCNVQVSDARPQAWFDAGKLAQFDPLRTRLTTWLEGQFAEASELVVKDPRLAWFVGLWRAAALRCDAAPAYITMLRPVTEVVGSKQKYYGGGDRTAGDVQRTAAWVNMMLHTERATRGSQRRFVRYADLLEDWTVPIFGAGQEFDLVAVQTAQANDIRAVHGFIDPSLRRVQLTWDDVDVPRRLREIAEESWQHLDRLADESAGGGDQPAVHDVLDQLRAAYGEYYGEAEALAQSTALASFRSGQAKAREELPALSGGASGGFSHRLRSLVPARARRWARRMLARGSGQERA